MANIFDYLKWRGDLTFTKEVFNNVDNLILSILSYVNFNGIIPDMESKKTISINEASDIFFELHSKKSLDMDKSFLKDSPKLLKAIANTQRFKNARLGKYLSYIEENSQVQFCAFHIYLDDGSLFIAFKGTDDTLIGWKEDFCMSFMEVGAQKAAVNYINNSMKGVRKKLRMGGHSKGGNLAIYGAAKCNSLIKKKIINVYGNDSPGFLEEFINGEEFKSISSKIITIIPKYSFFGLLFNCPDNYKIVLSNNRGAYCHDGLSWQVMGNDFVYTKELALSSQNFNEEMKEWLGPMDNTKKQEIINDLFAVIEATKVTTLSELLTGGIKNIITILKSFKGVDSDRKENIIKLIKIFMKCMM